MKDIFISEGKKYISSRRASEISDYSSDYIGQLCRAEKLDCKMIGRTWFVTEESVYLHKNEVINSEPYRNRIQNIRKSTKATIVNVTPQRVSNKTSQEEIKIEDKISKSPNITLSYLKDSGPLLPELDKKIKSDDSGRVISRYIAIDSKRSRLSVPHLTRSIILGRALSAFAFVMIVMGTLYVSPFIFNSSSINSTDKISTASVIDSIKNIPNLLKMGYAKIASIFNPKGATISYNDSHIPVPPYPPTSTSDMDSLGSQGARDGIVITPTTRSQTGDSLVIDKIRNSFSDEVNIIPDHSRTAGVIKPVFKSADSDDFLYVLVPVKDTDPNGVDPP